LGGAGPWTASGGGTHLASATGSGPRSNTDSSIFAPAVIGPWPLGPAVNDSGATKTPRLSGRRPVADPSRLRPSFTLWTREATHLSNSRRTGPYLSVWKVGRLFNHICTRTSRATRCGSGGPAAARQSRDDAGPSLVPAKYAGISRGREGVSADPGRSLFHAARLDGAGTPSCSMAFATPGPPGPGEPHAA
jgi:hypothetical protein